jgi:hypothetical protein
VYDPSTQLPWAGVPVVAVGRDYTFTTLTDQNGFYTMSLAEGSYDMTAGEFLPGYDDTVQESGIVSVPSRTTTIDFMFKPEQ